MPQQIPDFSAVVVSAPSGTGKTTLNRRLIKDFDNIHVVVSHTTRPPRPGETDGVHYHFINEEQFNEMIAADAFIEWARVHGCLYGTSREELERIQESGQLPLLEIDVQGWLKAREKLQNAISIFILPPTLQALWKRLEKRASDSLENRMIRLHNAYHEIAKAEHYDYFIVNDDLDLAYLKLRSLVVDRKPGDINATNGRELCERLKNEFHNAEWIRQVREKIGG